MTELEKKAEAIEPVAGVLAFHCRACGGQLQYEPGSKGMRCLSCAAEEAFPTSLADITELDFSRFAEQGGDAALTTETQTVTCPGCGAQVSLPSFVAAQSCAFCTTPLVIAQSQTRRQIRPQALLPFAIKAAAAQLRFRDWLQGRWFAPSALKKAAREEGGLQGIYLPYWTYDSDTETDFRGERGENRREEFTDASGKRQVRTVTDWFPASGTSSYRFDDVLAVGSRSLPPAMTEALEPWDLEQLLPYQAQYLSGFAAEAYQVSLQEGFEHARQRMQSTIETAVRQQIGGDQQRIHELQTRYDATTFKHVLLPIWISAYRFEGKVFRFLVNARSGEVQGERPWSVWKIGGLVLFILLLLGWFFLQQ